MPDKNNATCPVICQFDMIDLWGDYFKGAGFSNREVRPLLPFTDRPNQSPNYLTNHRQEKPLLQDSCSRSHKGIQYLSSVRGGDFVVQCSQCSSLLCFPLSIFEGLTMVAVCTPLAGKDTCSPQSENIQLQASVRGDNFVLRSALLVSNVWWYRVFHI